MAWLPVHMHGDGETQIVQLWDNQNKLGMTVWAPNAHNSYFPAWTSSDMGEGSGAIAWLPVDMHGDGKTEIVQLWDNHGKLSMIVWGPSAVDSYFEASHGDTGQDLAPTMAWLPVHMHGDGETQILQLWDNQNKLGMTVWAPNSLNSYIQAWTSRDMSQGSGAIAWLPVDMNGDGKTEIVQLWDNQRKLSMIVWAPKTDDDSYFQVGGGDTGQDLVPTMAWLPVHTRGNKTQIDRNCAAMGQRSQIGDDRLGTAVGRVLSRSMGVERHGVISLCSPNARQC
jgi:hypothetical protein